MRSFVFDAVGSGGKELPSKNHRGHDGNPGRGRGNGLESVYQRERGMQMLETVKKTLAKMAGIDIKKAQAKQASLTAVAH